MIELIIQMNCRSHIKLFRTLEQTFQNEQNYSFEMQINYSNAQLVFEFHCLLHPYLEFQ